MGSFTGISKMDNGRQHRNKPSSSSSIVVVVLSTLLLLLVLTVDVAEPADTLYLCMKNCEQCKNMYGSYFEGDLCAKSCFRLKGAFIPDCIDVASIGPFLNKNE